MELEMPLYHAESGLYLYEGVLRTHDQTTAYLRKRNAQEQAELARIVADVERVRRLKEEYDDATGPLLDGCPPTPSDKENSDDDDNGPNRKKRTVRFTLPHQNPAPPLDEPQPCPPALRVRAPNSTTSASDMASLAWIGRRTPGGVSVFDPRDASVAMTTASSDACDTAFVLRSPEGNVAPTLGVPRGRIRYVSSPVCFRPRPLRRVRDEDDAGESSPTSQPVPPPTPYSHAEYDDDEDYDFEPPLRRPPRSSHQRLHPTPTAAAPGAAGALSPIEAMPLRDHRPGRDSSGTLLSDDDGAVARRTAQVLDDLLSQMRLSTDVSVPSELGVSPPCLLRVTQRPWRGVSSTPARRPSVLLRDFDAD